MTFPNNNQCPYSCGNISANNEKCPYSDRDGSLHFVEHLANDTLTGRGLSQANIHGPPKQI